MINLKRLWIVSYKGKDYRTYKVKFIINEDSNSGERTYTVIDDSSGSQKNVSKEVGNQLYKDLIANCKNGMYLDFYINKIV